MDGSHKAGDQEKYRNDVEEEDLKLLRKKMYEEMSNSLETLLTIDPYDEDSVLELMEISAIGTAHKSSDLFQRVLIEN